MTIEVRTLRDADAHTGHVVFTTALAVGASSPETSAERMDAFFGAYSVGAFDGDRMVGHAGGLPFTTAVPGGALVATTGVTRVGVLPSHRRRGVLTAMMRLQLREARARGDVLASLRAAEAPIYGRFGYGMAGSFLDWRIDTRRGAFIGSVDDPGSIELVERADWMATVAAAYARAERRPGWIDRPTWKDRRSFGDIVAGDVRWVAVHRDRRGRPDGFVCWEPVDRDRWEERGHIMRVVDLWAADVEVERALWRFALDLDLVEVLWADGRPIDEPLRWMLADYRALEVRQQIDEQWVRIVDVPAALGARTYGMTGRGAADADIVLELFDPLLGDNEGTYRVGNAGVSPTRSRPDLTLPIAALGALYLGGTTFAELGRVGQIEEHRRGALARADRLFRSPVAPWCGTYF